MEFVYFFCCFCFLFQFCFCVLINAYHVITNSQFLPSTKAPLLCLWTYVRRLQALSIRFACWSHKLMLNFNRIIAPQSEYLPSGMISVDWLLSLRSISSSKFSNMEFALLVLFKEEENRRKKLKERKKERKKERTLKQKEKN